ncbi:peptidase U32 family protein [Spirochaeta lutea]|uniref:peptidase U32 family protein n=1 Tax=Spirochaeta lutea TaxID=1480694 RepID=UPI00068E3296|nr:peptidase U32 family protein [Spirochaeta lutea]
MELLAPAGSLDKLHYAYRYGADAAYIGLPGFSLRAKADNIATDNQDSPESIRRVKGSKKLYCTLNIYFHNNDVEELKSQLDRIETYPFDGFIISDIGILPILQKRFPDKELHLSTQANCVNREAAKMYHSMGFSRIVPGRELSLPEIREIKDGVPDLEIEAFIHGAMCLAYSGRCFLSSWMSGRSANKGDCAHSCRWGYRVALEEEMRPGEYYPLDEEEGPSGTGYTTIMSSKDICMIDYLSELRAAGVDSLKIEGRMKSLYYVAMITRAYRKELDRISRLSDIEIDLRSRETQPFIDELYHVSHREFSTGFYFGRTDIQKPTTENYRRSHLFLGSLEETPPEVSEPNQIPQEDSQWTLPVYLDVKNHITQEHALELVTPDIPFIPLEPGTFRFINAQGSIHDSATHGKPWFIQIKRSALARGRVSHAPLPPIQTQASSAPPSPHPGWILRRRILDTPPTP